MTKLKEGPAIHACLFGKVHHTESSDGSAVHGFCMHGTEQVQQGVHASAEAHIAYSSKHPLCSTCSLHSKETTELRLACTVWPALGMAAMAISTLPSAEEGPPPFCRGAWRPRTVRRRARSRRPGRCRRPTAFPPPADAARP